MVDALCFDDLDEFGRELDDPIGELEQDIVHMLFESYGSNVDARERSVGLEDALSGPVNPGLKRYIEKKLSDDPRVIGAQATITQLDDGTVRIDLKIQANESELGISLVFDGSGNLQRA